MIMSQVFVRRLMLRNNLRDVTAGLTINQGLTQNTQAKTRDLEGTCTGAYISG